jgi:hypothetical protein
VFGVLGVWLAAASAIDPAAIRLGYPLPAEIAFAAASLLIAADGFFCAGLVARAKAPPSVSRPPAPSPRPPPARGGGALPS